MHVVTASSSFLITPNVGLMVWTLVVFGISLFILNKAVFPRIGKVLDDRANAIQNSLDEAARIREEANKVLDDYRERLKEAREQAEEIITRARKSGETHEKEAIEQAKADRERLLEQARRDIEAETRRAVDEIRREVANLTVEATEKVTRKTLSEDDQRRLVEEALSELDFSTLSAGSANN
jgi:F-type H+-transporting ATPase subunit b